MMTVEDSLSFADRMYTKSSFAGVLAAEVRRLREENERLTGRVNKLGIEHAWAIGEARRLTEENERLRKDAERGCYFIERGEWFRHDHGTPDAHALLAIRLPYTADLSCKAMREFAIDAARGAK